MFLENGFQKSYTFLDKSHSAEKKTKMASYRRNNKSDVSLQI